ncbi:hypothetical protein [Vampirovibrio sp.]|uniref:hypothetical protein n=1 Tax=Vampirovibrio sp. TaxID=2717857 RepID=UPI003593AF83
MKIGKPDIVVHGDSAKLIASVEFAEQKTALWYQVDQQYQDYLVHEKLDGFLVGLLILAMKLGEDIELAAPVSEKLYYNLTRYYMPILVQIIPGLCLIDIHAHAGFDYGTSYEPPKGVVTGFSAGIDSFCTLADHLYQPDIPDSFKLTHLVFNNVGAHGDEQSEPARTLFNKRFHNIKSISEEIQLPFIKIDSNLSDLLQMNFQQTNTPRNISAVLILQKLFRKYYYASSCDYSKSFVGPIHDTCYSDPITLSLLSTETMECIPSGSQYTRSGKTKIVSELALSQLHLNVCVAPDEDAGNCGQCFKCLRTLLDLEILNKLENYSSLFNMTNYYRKRDWYKIKVLSGHAGSVAVELIQSKEEHGYHFRPYHYAAGALLKIIPVPLMKRFQKKLAIKNLICWTLQIVWRSKIADSSVAAAIGNFDWAAAFREKSLPSFKLGSSTKR